MGAIITGPPCRAATGCRALILLTSVIKALVMRVWNVDPC